MCSLQCVCMVSWILCCAPVHPALLAPHLPTHPHLVWSRSPQQIVSCDLLSLGCHGGDTVLAYNYVENTGGLMTEASYVSVNERERLQDALAMQRVHVCAKV